MRWLMLGEGSRLDQAARRRRGAMQIVELPVRMVRLHRQHAADLGRGPGIERARRLAAHPLARLEGGEIGAQRRKAVRFVPQASDGEFAFGQADSPSIDRDVSNEGTECLAGCRSGQIG